MNKRIDLHTHTSFSDGSLTPTQLVKYAAEKNINVLSITDHNAIKGVEEAIEAGKLYNIEIIPGIEITADYNTQMHILGYYIDIKSDIMTDFLNDIKNNRMKEITKVFRKLSKLDIKIDPSEIVRKGMEVDLEGVISVMIDKGYIKSRHEAMDKYFDVGRPVYVEKKKLSPQSTIEIIKKSRGIAILAHPVRLKKDIEDLENFIRELIDYGLDGIECYHSEQPFEVQEQYLGIARKYNLLVTGGSDYHGLLRPDIDLGTGRGDLKIPCNVLSNLVVKKK